MTPRIQEVIDLLKAANISFIYDKFLEDEFLTVGASSKLQLQFYPWETVSTNTWNEFGPKPSARECIDNVELAARVARLIWPGQRIYAHIDDFFFFVPADHPARSEEFIAEADGAFAFWYFMYGWSD